jgi:hypothetical protein
MVSLPRATVTIDDESGAQAQGELCVVLGCVEQNEDLTPRVFSSAKSILEQHGYSQAVDYAALHIEGTGRPVLFVGLPKATAGALGHQDSSGMTGTSKISVAAGANGYLDEIDGVITVTTGGTVGVNGIVLSVSADGGRTEKTVRLGTASTYTFDYLGAVVSFGSGTLVAEDVFRFRVSAPMWDSAGIAAARTALAAQQKLSRSWLVAEELANATFAGYVTTQVNAYETANERFTYARGNVKDRLPLAKLSKVKNRMSGSPSVTFAEVGATGDTITRATGSFITDGFAVGDRITVSGTASNNFTDAKITGVTATVLTLDTQDLVAEVTTAAVIVGSASIDFAEVGATGDTITRSSGSFVTDGFEVGDIVQITGTASNNITTDAIANVSATVLTLASSDLTAESIASHRITIEKVLSKSAWISAKDSAFASVDGQKRLDLGVGRLRHSSPITGWEPRRPVAWAASIREYQHDLHIPCWRKDDGPLLDWSMVDDDGNIVEFDERVDGGALAARFTCARTWANGPNGAFVALSLTRADENSLLSRTHNMSVANLACQTVHASTENAIGQVLTLNEDDGTASEDSLIALEEKVNSDLEEALLRSRKEGQRASKAVWKASRTDRLNVVPAVLTGVLDLVLNGTLEQIDTAVKVS